MMSLQFPLSTTKTLTFLLLCLPFILDSALGLKCWVCSGNSSPLCEGNHEGVSKECPTPNENGTIDHPIGHSINSEYVCMIMKTISKATEAIEITKGCTIQNNYFAYSPDGNVIKDLTPGMCYTHDDDRIYDRFVKSHDVTICICDTDNCNKVTMEYVDMDKQKMDIGREDILARQGKKASGAPNPPQSLAFLLITLISVVAKMAV